jgi:hypothetical protein
MSESTSAWLTVSQAAARLGISERQARRYAGRLAPDDRREAGLGAGHVSGALVRLEAMAAQREKATGHVQSPLGPDTKGLEPNATPDVGPDTSQSTLATHLLEENRFLRAALEARDRDAAELRAALREALKISSRALVESTSPSALPGDLDASSVEQLEPKKEKPGVPTQSTHPTSATATGPALIEAQGIEAQAAPKYFERSKGLRAMLLRWLKG